jgi:hypothetical protein
MSVSIGGTAGVTFNDASVQNTAATGFGFKSRIINGAMVIDQRNAGASVTPTTSNTYALDRWTSYIGAASKFSVQQNAGSVTPPVGFTKYLGVTSLAATSLATSDYYAQVQPVEGFNIADFGWGSANAVTVTLSFRVYSSLTGTFGGSLRNGAGDRSYPFTYSIPVANTWTTISIIITGDVTGTWATGNTSGALLCFGLGVGSTYSGTAGAWAAANYLSATGAVSVVGTSGATFYITGVQLEKGSTATSFDYRPYSTELQLAQRYCIVYGGDSVYNKFATGGTAASTTSMLAFTSFPVEMRTTPSFAYAGSWAASNGVSSQTLSNIVISATESSPAIAKVVGTSTGMTSLIPYFIEAINSTASTATFSSEL